MDKQILGKSNIPVSKVGLGTMAFGRWIDTSASQRIIDHSLDIGMTLIDTANFYGKRQDIDHIGDGLGEQMIGNILKGKRDQVILATKVGMRMGEGKMDEGLSRQHITQQIDRSLQRLQTDYIDLYQVHEFDPHTPLEETLFVLHELVQQGKVRAIGYSNFAVDQLRSAYEISHTHQWTACASIQSEFNLLARAVEQEVFPYCEQVGIGKIIYSPLARGILAGRYRSLQEIPVESRLAKGEKRIKHYFTNENFAKVDTYRQIAEEVGCTLVQLVLWWTMEHPQVDSMLIGASRTAHIDEIEQVLQFGAMPASLRNHIASIH